MQTSRPSLCCLSLIHQYCVPSSSSNFSLSCTFTEAMSALPFNVHHLLPSISTMLIYSLSTNFRSPSYNFLFPFHLLHFTRRLMFSSPCNQTPVPSLSSSPPLIWITFSLTLQELGVPYVTVFGGTDVNECVRDTVKREVMERVVFGAKSLVAFQDSMRDTVLQVWVSDVASGPAVVDWREHGSSRFGADVVTCSDLRKKVNVLRPTFWSSKSEYEITCKWTTGFSSLYQSCISNTLWLALQKYRLKAENSFPFSVGSLSPPTGPHTFSHKTSFQFI